MNKPTSGLKEIIKPYLNKCAELPAYCRKQAQKFAAAAKDKNTRKKYQKKLTGFIALIAERWRLVTLISAGFITIYYGLGAAVSSQIYNPIDTEIKPHTVTGKYLPPSVAYVLKTQVDDSAWVPALPAIFPAAVLDNLPNFQLGVKDSTRFLTKRLAVMYNDDKLKQAGELLDYPADIWLFSQTGEDKLAPGSAKQYRKAMAKIAAAVLTENNDETTQTHNLKYILESFNIILKRQITKLEKQVQEHNSETLDFKADDIFFYVQGNVYTLYYALLAVSKDYQDIIVKTEQYEHLTTALKYFKDAENLSPLSVQNGAPEDSYAANHLLYLAYYLAQAQNQINAIRCALK